MPGYLGQPDKLFLAGRTTAVVEDVGQWDGEAGQQRRGEGVGGGEGRPLNIFAIPQF